MSDIITKENMIADNVNATKAGRIISNGGNGYRV